MDPQEQGRLVRACQTGNQEAFSALYEAFLKPIYNFIYYKTHHRETAEDLTSQTFFKALDTISRCDPDKGTFSSWIYRIARNTVIDHYRTAKLVGDIEDHTELKSTLDQTEETHVRLELAKVENLLSALTPDQREVLILRFWQQLSFAEISTVLSISEGTAKMRLARGVSALKQVYPSGGLLLFIMAIVVSSIWTI